MRRAAPDERPVTLTVAGSDSGGGAGIQADLKTMEAHGAFGTSAVTAVTAQNTTGVLGSHVLPTEKIEAQIDAVTDDFAVEAIKTGMLATAPVVELVAEAVAAADAPAVVDPVMVAASGDRLLEPAAESAYEALIAECALVTPNADEAEVLTDSEIKTVEDAEAAGEDLVEMGADAALVKGGHLRSDGDSVVDVFVTPREVVHFEHPRIDTDATHGSGCTLSSAIAVRLALGESLRDAVAGSVAFMERAVRYHHDVGEGPGAVHHLVGIRERADRDRVAQEVDAVVARLDAEDARTLVSESLLQVAGATPYAETVADVAAVKGGVAATQSGLRANRGVCFGAAPREAAALLGVRDVDADQRFCATVRATGVDEALAALDWNVVEYETPADRSPALTGVTDAVADAVDATGGTPAALVASDTTPTTASVVGGDATQVANRLLSLADELERA
jgi:hydroxymethylpyrimidine/phosphomethylpyrimidine kinase